MSDTSKLVVTKVNQGGLYSRAKSRYMTAARKSSRGETEADDALLGGELEKEERQWGNRQNQNGRAKRILATNIRRQYRLR